MPLRIFVVDRDDTVFRFPFSRYERFMDRDYALSQFATERIREAEVMVEVNGRELVRVLRSWFVYFPVDELGLLDKDKWLEQFASAVGQIPVSPRRQGSVINAQADFAKRRYEREATWQPTDEILSTIRQFLWDRLKLPSL